MSVKASRIVWRARIGPPTTKLVLLAFADFLNEKTGRLDPSHQKVADKVGISRCQAQRIVRQCIDEGLLSVLANHAGGNPGATPRYRLNLELVATLPQTGLDELGETGEGESTGSASDTGSTDAQEGSHGCQGGVAPMLERGSAGATQTGMNHKEPKENRKSARTAKPQKVAMPSDFGISERVRAWAQDKGHTNLEAHLESFIGKVRANGYLYINWDDALMNAIRDDWARLGGKSRGGGYQSTAPAGRHVDFGSKDFRNGVAADGSFT